MAELELDTVPEIYHKWVFLAILLFLLWTIELATLTSLINKEVINGSQRVFERMKKNTLEAFQELTTRNTISWLVTAAMKLKDVCSLEEKLWQT